MAKELITRLQKKTDFEAIVKNGKPFTDPEFPPKESLLSGFEQAKKWARADEMFKGKQKIYNSFSPDDIIQGELGDCYWLSAVSALAEFPGRVEKLFPIKAPNPAGCYAVTLFIAGQPTTIVVDDFFPATVKDKPAFSGTRNAELWVMLLEKAWAKLHKGFQVIEGGDSRESLSVLTGCHVDFVKHASKSEDEMWKLIFEADKQNYLMCTGSDKEIKGIKPGHAYTLINAYEIKQGGKAVRLVQVRNPWGDTEWEGEWCDKDPQWTPELNAKLNHKVEDDGTFFMNFSDFYKVFIHTFIAKSKDDYVSSYFSVEGTSMIATFKVPNKLKANISAHQITGRLGKTVKPTHKVDPMQLFVFKWEEGKAIPKGSAQNNAVGIATVEVELDAGTYVVNAKFVGEPVFPYIGFVINGTKAFDIAKVDAASMPEVSEAKITSAFGSIKQAFSNSNKSSGCLFNKCTQGHELIWNFEPSPADDLCESCRKKYDFKEGKWSCKPCGYDICSKCRPQNMSIKIGSEVKEEAKLMCAKGHKMEFETSEVEGLIYMCDQCGKAYLGKVPRWRCDECDQDICFACLPPKDPAMIPKGFPEITTCYRGHEIVFTDRAMRSNTYECDFCNRLGDPQQGRWGCLTCNFNICGVCKANPSGKTAVVFAQTGITVCPKKHPLSFTSYAKADEAFICDKCSKQVPPDNWRWSCLDCQFDVCSQCRPEPPGRKDVLCKKMHKLCYSVNLIGLTGFTRCSKCHKAFNVTNGRHECVLCQYQLCLSCCPVDEEMKEHAPRPRPESRPEKTLKDIVDESKKQDLLESGSHTGSRECGCSKNRFCVII